MSTITKLNYLSDTKDEIKDALNSKFNAGITDNDTFRSYVDKIKGIYTNWPKVTGTGTEITLTPTRKGRMQLDLKGNTSQDSTTGKNLLNVTLTSETGRGITATKLEDGSVKLTGTATAIKAFKLGTIHIENGKTYIISGSPINSDDAVRLDARPTNSSNSVYNNWTSLNNNSYTATEDTDVDIYVRTTNGYNTNGIIIWPQVEEGSTATEWEPYTGGQPSPNPDYPQPIHVVTGNNTITVQGQNLFDKDGNIITGKYLDANGQAKNQIGTWYTDYYIPVKPNTSYISSGGSFANRICCYDSNKNFIIRYNAEASTYSITTPVNCYYIRLSNNGGYDNLQFEQGSTATSYVPYYHADYPINLGSIELCKIGDYQDYLYKENGNWYKHKAINKGNFNDIYRDRTIKVASYIKPGLVAYAISVLPVKKIGANNFEVFCDNFSQKYLGSTTDTTDTNSVRNSEGIASHTGNVDQLVISIDKTRLSGTSVEDFYSYITNLNPQIAYILNTPITTQITDETLISQLDAIENAMSTTDTTTITQTNSDLPFIISASALKKGGN